MVSSGPGTGYEVAKWMADNMNKGIYQVPHQVVIHSFNPAGAAIMEQTLRRAGIDAIRYPGYWNS